MKLEIDPSKVKVKDMVDFEKATGLLFANVGSAGTPSGLELQGLIWITQRRAEPEFTFEDAGEVELSALDFATVEATDPT